jgi:hypothetical protein
MNTRDMDQGAIQRTAHALYDVLDGEGPPEEALAALLTAYCTIAGNLPEFKRLQFGKLLTAAGDEMLTNNSFNCRTH